MKWNRISGFVAGLVFTAVAGASGLDGVEISVEPVFGKTPSTSALTPLRVQITNPGSNINGNFTVQGGQFKRTYPVEVAAGATKTLTIYSKIGYSGLTVRLATDHGSVARYFDLGPIAADSRTVVMISDRTQESLSFLESSRRENSNTFNPDGTSNQATSLRAAYVLPTDAPDRAVAYQPMSAVILGSGTEKLTDASVRALGQYALTGGTLIFFGGANSEVLKDARWAKNLPVSHLGTAVITDAKALSEFADEIAPDRFPITIGKQQSGSIELAALTGDQSFPLIEEKSLGLGRVLFLAFDPFSGAIADWSGRKTVMQKVLRMGNRLGGQQFINNSIPLGPGTTGSDPEFNARRVSLNKLGVGTLNSTVPANDPFSAKLPPASQVLMILVGYFIAVVPLNFLILKKLNRGELAWVTAPLISLAFAGTLFGSAKGLYTAQLSTATQGILIAQQGNPNGVFYGSTQMFFPTAGNYDLQLHGIQTLDGGRQAWEGANTNNSFSPDISEMNAVDNGEIKVANLRASSLEFKDFSYEQNVNAGSWFTIETMELTRQGRAMKVTNHSGFKMTGLTLKVGAKNYAVPDISNGQSATVSAGQTAVQTSEVTDVLQESVRKSKVPILFGQLEGFRPGPQIGQEFAPYSSKAFAFFGEQLR